ncbi:MAG: transposase [Oscillospiraceae bacterium]|nr:transposase [Oscillospiraceae bacterium]
MEQTCWNNYNEGSDLENTVQDYRRKFGCYPKAVLADKIYQTRKNRKFCKEHGIRLSGPPLGRRKNTVTDAAAEKQIYRDACARNAVEGRNGNLKRCHGLDLIMCKLDECAKTEAALDILAMNAAYRLRLWLIRFFVRIRILVVFQ